MCRSSFRLIWALERGESPRGVDAKSRWSVASCRACLPGMSASSRAMTGWRVRTNAASAVVTSRAATSNRCRCAIAGQSQRRRRSVGGSHPGFSRERCVSSVRAGCCQRPNQPCRSRRISAATGAGSSTKRPSMSSPITTSPSRASLCPCSASASASALAAVAMAALKLGSRRR